MTNTSFSIKTVRRAVRSTGIKAVTKQKWPFLFIQKEWEAIPASVCQNLILSMPRRVEDVLQTKRGHTRYYNVRILF